MNENMKVKPVKDKERIPFHCQLCGACCRQVKDSIMLEPMDIYCLSRFLRDRGEPIEGPEDMLARYTHPDMLAERLPIFLLNTEGPEDACVFLKDGRCSVYEARPRVCRTPLRRCRENGAGTSCTAFARSDPTTLREARYP